MLQARYAIYFVPSPSDALWELGTLILGYNSRTGEECSGFFLEGIEPSVWLNWTASPRLYGLHATLVAPFELQLGHIEQELIDRLDQFCRCQNGINLKSLTLCALGDFVALCPLNSDPELQSLAFNLVKEFNAIKAPLTEFDFKRRLKPNLSGRQIKNLEVYGYPYVNKDFRFHITLTGSLPADRLDDIMIGLKHAFADHEKQPVQLNTLCLMKQDNREARFRVLAECPLASEFIGLGAWR